MRKKMTIAILLLLVFLTHGCNQPQLYTRDFVAMDTIFSVTLPESKSSVVEEMIDTISNLHKLFDWRDPGSDIWRVNNHLGRYVKVSAPTYDLIYQSIQIAEETNGSFDPTVGPLVDIWDYEKELVPSNVTIKNVLPLVNYRNVKFKEQSQSVMLEKTGMKLNVGAIAKGYAVKKELELLRQQGVKTALISAGGNNYALGTKPDGSPWKIGIRHPRKREEVIGYVELHNKALDTSGDYERYFVKDGVRYHHIIDPKTGYPAEGLISVTVITEDPVRADALATAIFVMGPEKALEFVKKTKDIEVIMVTDKMNVLISPGAKKIFHPAEGIEIHDIFY